MFFKGSVKDVSLRIQVPEGLDRMFILKEGLKGNVVLLEGS